MYCMFVTLDVSRLSGWLNADAARNIPCMVTTLEVSRLSGWLNANVLCRVERGGRKRGACGLGNGRARGGGGASKA